MVTVPVEVPGARYEVTVGRGLLSRAGEWLSRALGDRQLAIIADEAVWRLHGQRLFEGMGRLRTQVVLQVPSGEKSKTLAVAGRLAGQLLAAGCDRKTLLVAFGGGVTGDLAGFVAAIFMRGIDFVQIPTTLLAMVDSSVGGKVAVNHPLGKNTIGAFHQPRAVLADLDLLETLPPREIAAGAVEAVKYGLLGDGELLKHCLGRPPARWDLDRVVADSVRDKAEVVVIDERESGPRRRLNLGHTLGHALEAVTRYRRYLHGEAVALGTLYALRLSMIVGHASESDFVTLSDLYRSMQLPMSLPKAKFETLLAGMARDKKASQGTPLFILPVGLGEVTESSNIPRATLERAYHELHQALAMYS